MAKRITFDAWVERARSTHGDKYDYTLSKEDYTTTCGIVRIVCPEHGVFKQKASEHYKYGCKACAVQTGRRTRDDVIAECTQAHGGKYDYAQSYWTSMDDPSTTILCPDHGAFTQRMSDHRKGMSGCIQCSRLQARTTMSDRFGVPHFNLHHVQHLLEYQDNDAFSAVLLERGPIGTMEYFNIKSWALNHRTREAGIDPSMSYLESDMLQYVRSIYRGEIVLNTRSIISPYEVDIWIPDLKVGIEMHGLYWHSTAIVEPDYHLRKQQLAVAAGIRLIQVFEYEWIKSSDIVKTKIRHILGHATDKVYARKCTVDHQVPFTEYVQFCSQHHIQGARYGVDVIKGLRFNEELVAVMSMRSNILERYCSSVHVVGGFSKLLNTVHGDIVTYADLRYSDPRDNVYLTNGFVVDGQTPPNYKYWKPGEFVVQSREKFQKHKILALHPTFDPLLTEAEMMDQLGYYKIYDAGHLRLIRMQHDKTKTQTN